MKKYITLLFYFWIPLAFSQSSDYAKQEIILKFNQEINFSFDDNLNTFDNELLDQLNKKEGISECRVLGNRKTKLTYLFTFSSEKAIDQLIETYMHTGLFEFVEANYIGHGGGIQTIPDDFYFDRQYGLLNDGTFSLSPATVDADIDMDLAWDVEQGDSAIVMAILDSGMKMDHPEFENRIWSNPAEEENEEDSDDNGYVDDIRGWDFAYDDNNPTDDHGHGTNVSGIAAATGNNEIGYAGVDWNCKIMNLKILDNNNSGYYSWWVDAIYYAVDHGANVLNMSVGGSGASSSMNEAVDYAYDNDVVIVACMMNTDNNVSYIPASYENTIAVGSTNPNDERSSPFFWSSTSGSNYGDHIDVVAPGNYIYGLSYNSNTNYNGYWGGTSQATPLVSGLSTLLLAQDPSRTPDDIRLIIRTTAEDQVGDVDEDSEGFDEYYGYGRVNANEALNYSLTGIKENQSAIHFSIYPNPTSDGITIKTSARLDRIEIVNYLGSLAYSQDFMQQKNSFSISTETMSKGLYIVRLYSAEKTAVKKLIIQ